MNAFTLFTLLWQMGLLAWQPPSNRPSASVPNEQPHPPQPSP